MEKRTRSAEKSEGVGAISLCFCLKEERENVKGCGERERKREMKRCFSERGVKRRGRERGERGKRKRKRKRFGPGPDLEIFVCAVARFLIFRFFCNFVVLIQTCKRAVAQRKNAAAQTCVLPKFEL